RRQQRADDDHRGDGVGDGHQRRMQRRRHPPHHVVADEAGQREDRQQRDERHVAVGHVQRVGRRHVEDLLRHRLEVGGEVLRLGGELGGFAGESVVHCGSYEAWLGGGLSEGGTICPFWVTSVPFTTSS